ncbi:transient receptor potential cation channel protein painless [Scaptodrosophila lebanonensis]|uniref:Transient receptor potential cation channel protein painless n=1 Tax=Drosophila lebanonensis TaxID=7225 RepID=A0A6J2TTH4_DROLE|nr:transient receptor potential cation channel protein painless [Scaptodrosophila lebanonensis]XP_030378448.1 transient receptor potential cation channel protein painless [Scaptodrosophila lebanonensis]
MDLNNCGFIDPQAQLSAALANRDLREFRNALDNGAQPTMLDERNTSIYEKVLATPECAEFVQACLDHGCNVNYINQHINKAAINYAADSRDPDNLSALLRHRGVQVDRKYSQLTPLNSLAKNLTAENAAKVSTCMQLLLNYGASTNIPDQRQMTPLHYVLKNRNVDESRQRELVSLFLSRPELDIDSYRNGEVRTLLQTLHPDLHLPAVREVSQDIDCETLLRHLRNNDESQFEQQFSEYQRNISDTDNQRNTTQEQYLPLLVESIMRGLHRAFDAILRTGVNISAQSGTKTPVEIAIIWGNWVALDKLLHHDELNLNPRAQLLNTVISKLDEQPFDEFCDYQKCFEILLSSEHVNVNEVDKSGTTPLHYAVKYRNIEAVKALLRHGAYIGMRSAFNDLPIQNLQLEVLEEHFDSCITTNGLKPGETGFEIIINYMNLMHQDQYGLQANKQLHDEMTPVAYIAESKELRQLLQHPLITSFLFLKWHRLSAIFYINFLLYLLFTISIITHTMLKLHQSEQESLTLLFGLFSWIGITYLVIRECLQFAMAPVLYFRSITNIMEIALIILSILNCTVSTYEYEMHRVIAVFTILLVSVELCLLVGSLPVLSISTHMLMLRAVSSSFMKSFTLYSILVITFSLCFYILFGKPDVKGQDEKFNAFVNPFGTLIKTIVMLTGEFDAGDIKFDSFYSYILFLLFVFFMTIILFNLLNGLAVSDTQAIKAQAELNGAICRTNLLTRYELVLTGRGRTGYIVNTEPFRSICRRLMNIYPNYMSVRQISILPNDGNKVLIPRSNSYERNQNSSVGFLPLPTNTGHLLDPPLSILPCCCSCLTGRCAEIDNRTAKLALNVIDRKSCAERKRQLEQQTERRLQIIEQKTDRILQLLQERS